MSRLLLSVLIITAIFATFAIIFSNDLGSSLPSLRKSGKKKASQSSGFQILSSSPFDSLRRHPTRREILSGKPPGIYVVDPSSIDGVSSSGVHSRPGISTNSDIGAGSYYNNPLEGSPFGQPLSGFYSGTTGRPGGIFESGSSYVPNGASLWSGTEDETWTIDNFRRNDRTPLIMNQVWVAPTGTGYEPIQGGSFIPPIVLPPVGQPPVTRPSVVQPPITQAPQGTRPFPFFGFPHSLEEDLWDIDLD